MKKIFSIILPLLFLSGGIVFAFNMQDDPACTTDEHIGYRYTGEEETPPLPFDPDAPLPEDVESLGQFEVDFECESNELAQCHWAFIPPNPMDPQDQGTWVPCSGDYEEIENP